MVCSSYPCGAGRRMLNILGNGYIYPCGELVFVDDLEIKYEEFINENLLDLINKRFGKLINNNIYNIEGCARCVFKNICTNGCTGRTYYLTGKLQTQSPFCRLYKKIILFLLDNLDHPLIKNYVNITFRKKKNEKTIDKEN